MEDVMGVLGSLSDLQRELEVLRQAHFQELDQLFYGLGSTSVSHDAEATAEESVPTARSGGSSVTPQQTKKRAKRLSSLVEDKDELEGEYHPGVGTDAETSTDFRQSSANSSTRQSTRVNNSQLLAIAEGNLNTTASLMPPPPVPAVTDITLNSGRPQRAAKLKSEKLLKEPSLNRKMRRPSQEESIRVKVESEQRPSQFNSSTSRQANAEKVPQQQPEQDSVLPAPKETEPVTDQPPEDINTSKNLIVKIKREKMSSESLAPATEVTASSTVILEATQAARPNETVSSNTTATTEPGKKLRKKKKDLAECHKPIKIERFSDLDKDSPVSSRTRKGSTESRANQEHSIYTDALEGPPSAETVAPSNATMVIGPAPTTDDSPRGPAADATFEVPPENKKAPTKQDSLLTEDESLEDKLPVAKTLSNIKAMKLPARAHELFNPLLQSPVKMRVEAFENAAQAQTNLRPKRTKDVQGTPGSSITPKVGRLPPPVVGRFYTPTQTSSMLPASSAMPKKAPASASKATTLMKTATGTNLKSTNSSSTKSLVRENSGDDFRKGLHNLAEERKKMRELKHQQAAQQREAKDRERAERMAKLTAERAKKQEERKRIEERKRQETEEQLRKMRQQEEAEALKKAKLKELEQQKLQQLTGAKAKKMLPPPPKTKYTWEMLHEDDSTDDEGKVTHKRPPAPTWSRSHVRGDAILMQSHVPTEIIDSFFSVAPTTPDLKEIFPNIDPSLLRRNSSVLWSTPPRYSELPKY
ncbi:inner centromere protein isoform X1 [Drosophila kikkawai]|uniref:Inner centromere protein isoform X1 n=1 Tax=Drosophila kikkawai TaxID=30033 RepID=A0A6P4J918_DROKI|nr:inner centromere protein isoform X1 [Drosophila kikkawai]XP_017031971.1 inner centromere protein isoform X1 [Drosophila kikkawai]